MTTWTISTICQQLNPASLNTLISEMSKIRKSLHLLVPKEDLGDCISAHKMSKLVDRPTREAWETSRVSTKELPKYEDFEAFLVSRVRTLEIASDAPPSSSKQSAAHSKPLKAYTQDHSTSLHLLRRTSLHSSLPGIQTP